MDDYVSPFAFLFFLFSFIYSWPILEIFFNLTTFIEIFFNLTTFYMRILEWPHLSSDRGA